MYDPIYYSGYAIQNWTSMCSCLHVIRGSTDWDS